MKDLFLQGFDRDLEKISEIIKNDACKKVNDIEAMRIHDDFWDSLNDKQKDKYREFEMVLGQERLTSEENIYLFALKKGFVMGYELARELK